MLRLRSCTLEAIKGAQMRDPTVPSCSCILFLSDKAKRFTVRFTVTLLFYPHSIFNEVTLEHFELRAVPGVQRPLQPEWKPPRLCLFSTAPGNCLSWASVLLCPSVFRVWILPKPVWILLSTSPGFGRIQSLLSPCTGLVGPVALLSQPNVLSSFAPNWHTLSWKEVSWVMVPYSNCYS